MVLHYVHHYAVECEVHVITNITRTVIPFVYNDHGAAQTYRRWERTKLGAEYRIMPKRRLLSTIDECLEIAIR